MRKKTFLFIGLNYLFSFLGFGGIILTNTNFQNIFSNPLTITLFIIGGLVPGIIGIILSKSKLFIDFKNLKPLTILFFVIFLLVNTMLFGLFGGINKIDNLGHLALSIIICTIVFGLQEVGWIDIIYNHYYPIRGMFKSISIIGLLKSITFLPLTLLPGFILSPEHFAYFAVYLIGTSALSVFLRKYSDSVLISVLFIGILYGIMSFMNLNLEMRLIVIGFALGIIVYGLQDLIKE